LAKSMSAYLISELAALPNVKVRLHTTVVDVEGDDYLRGVLVHERRQGTVERIPADGLFVMIGAEPRTEWLDGLLERDERGFVLTGRDLRTKNLDGDVWIDRGPLLLETSVPGLFAAGDVRHGSIKRVTTAMGEGATVVHLVHEYLESA